MDQIFTVLLSTSMFVGGVVGFFLDNTLPGRFYSIGRKSRLFQHFVEVLRLFGAIPSVSDSIENPMTIVLNLRTPNSMASTLSEVGDIFQAPSHGALLVLTNS